MTTKSLIDFPPLPPFEWLPTIGCRDCTRLPIGIGNTYTEIDGEHLYDTNQQSFHLDKCTSCGQIYLNEFTEERSPYGDDPMWNTWYPLSDKEVELIRETITETSRDTATWAWLELFKERRKRIYTCNPSGRFFR